jgi:uncharacterized membrane protein
MIGSRRPNAVFRPVSLLYFLILFLTFGIIAGVILLIVGDLLVTGLGIPPTWVDVFLLVSLMGSFLNIPVATLESRVPVLRLRRVIAFGVNWQIPSVEFGVTKTHVMVNVGGALLPVVTSAWILGYSIPLAPHPAAHYVASLVVLIVVMVIVNRTAQVIEGLGVATPALIPPVVTALATIAIDYFSPLSVPAQVAYVGGTLGTLIGADLLNLHKIKDLGAPVVSIGGAGTFDGVYLTGLVSVLLVVLVL